MRSVSAYVGLARRIDSSANQPARGTIRGSPGEAVTRSGTFDTGLRTVSARARVTRPVARTSSPTARPTQTGALVRHPFVRRASAEPASGPSLSSSTTGVQADQPPEAARVRSWMLPFPRQWMPTSWNGDLVDTELSDRSPWSASSRTSSVARPAAAEPGNASAAMTKRRRRRRTMEEIQGGRRGLRRQALRPFPDGMLTRLPYRGTLPRHGAPAAPAAAATFASS
jgi:hypothetical protein